MSLAETVEAPIAKLPTFASEPALSPPGPTGPKPVIQDVVAKEADKGRIGAATRPNVTPLVTPVTKPADKREPARTSPAVRTSIGLRKPAAEAKAVEPPKEQPAPDEAPPTVGRPMPPPRSRSNTPKVTNAVQKARAMDEALATPSPKPAARPAGMRIPVSATSDRRTPQSASVPPEAKAPATALRFGERAPEPAPTPGPGLPGGRKETLKLNRATQDFAVKMLHRDADRAEQGKRPSGPPLDLHLPLELSLDEPLESVQLRDPVKPGHRNRAALSPLLPPAGDDAPDISLDDDIHVSMNDTAELAPDELAAVDELDDVLDGFVDSLPGAAVQAAALRSATRTPVPPAAPTPVPSAAPTPIPPGPPSLRDLDLSLEMDDPRSPEAPQPPSLDPSTTRGFQEDEPALAPIRDRVARGDFMGALMRAEAILQTEPNNVGATYFATMCQEKIRDLYIHRLGSGEGIPHVQLAPDAIVALALDHRSGFLISLIDGIASIDDVLDMSGMPTIEALRLLLELKNEGVIGID